MKTFLAIIGGLVLLVVLGVIVLAWIGEQASSGDSDTSGMNSAIIGTWRPENSNDNETSVTYTQSGEALLVIPSKTFAGLLGAEQCRVSGSYSVGDYSEIHDAKGNPMSPGTYVRYQFTTKLGTCPDRFSKLPVTLYDKVDVVDANHLLIGPYRWVRSN